jgi:RNA polymerase sigma-70 factor (ECF subfamily)
MAGPVLVRRAEAHGMAPPVSGVSRPTPSSVESPDFETVYADYFEFIWRSVRGLGIPPAFVDDVTQDVFLIVHRKLSTLESPSSLRSWLFGITRRVCKDHRRSASRKGLHLELDPQREVDGGSDPQQRVVSRQQLGIVEDYALGLDDERRALFFLVLVEGLQVADAAETLGMNVNTAYSRVRALRRELAQKLGVVDRSASERGNNV